MNYVPLKRQFLQEPYGITSPEDGILHRNPQIIQVGYIFV
jgi:hypothetical protein